MLSTFEVQQHVQKDNTATRYNKIIDPNYNAHYHAHNHQPVTVKPVTASVKFSGYKSQETEEESGLAGVSGSPDTIFKPTLFKRKQKGNTTTDGSEDEKRKE